MSIPDRLFNGSGVLASEPGAEREYDAPAKYRKRTCASCGATWTAREGVATHCPAHVAAAVAIGRAFAHYEAVCTWRANYGEPGPICGVVEVVHGSRVCGGYLGAEFICDTHDGGNVPCEANVVLAASIAERVAEHEAAMPTRATQQEAAE